MPARTKRSNSPAMPISASTLAASEPGFGAGRPIVAGVPDNLTTGALVVIGPKPSRLRQRVGHQLHQARHDAVRAEPHAGEGLHPRRDRAASHPLFQERAPGPRRPGRQAARAARSPKDRCCARRSTTSRRLPDAAGRADRVRWPLAHAVRPSACPRSPATDRIAAWSRCRRAHHPRTALRRYGADCSPRTSASVHLCKAAAGSN